MRLILGLSCGSVTKLQHISIVIISVILFSSSQVFAQQQTVGEKPNEEIKIKIDENGTAHVVHIVQGNSNAPVHVETIQGNMNNFTVTDSNNTAVQYFSIRLIPKTIMIPPSERNMTLIKYDLVNAVSLHNGIYKWNYTMPSDTTHADFHFPSKVDMIWVNSRPIFLGENGLLLHGDEMKLEYVINEPVDLQNIKWQNYSFTVAVRSLSDIKQNTFDQSSMSYSFQVTKPNSFVTIIIPQFLLGGHYTVHINGNHLLTNTFHTNGTHSWIGVRPSTNGTLQIIGTSVVPEFPLFMPLVIGIIMILIFQFRTKLYH